MRRAARAQRFAHRPGWQRWNLNAATALLWPLGALRGAIRAAALAQSESGTPARIRLDPALRAYLAALRHNVPPFEYFRYRLWEPEMAQRVDCFVYRNERGSLLAALNAGLPASLRAAPGATDVTDDKLAFHDHAREQSWPTPALVAVFSRGGSLRPGPDWMPDGELDLWVKPRRGRQARGAERWYTMGRAGYRNQRGHILSRKSWRIRLCDRSIEEDMLVQPALANHPDIAPLTNGALASLRILSGRWPSGEVALVSAVANLPRAKDATSVPGLVSPIDLESGRLGAAFDLGRPDRLIRNHPDSGARIAGHGLSDWSRIAALIVRAHAAVPGFAFLGWDVALTPTGPVLLEANSGFGVAEHQFADRKPRPLGCTLFGDIARAYLGGA